MTLKMGLASRLTPSTWTESVLHTQLQKERKKEKNPNNYQIPRSVASRGGGGGWRDSRNSGPISRQRQQREQSSGVQKPRPEMLSVRGSSLSSGSEPVDRAMPHSLLWLSPRLQVCFWERKPSLLLSYLGSPSLEQAAIGNSLTRAKRKLHTQNQFKVAEFV